MSATEAGVGVVSDGFDRRRELQAFDDTKAGVKGLVDAGVTAIPAIFRHPPESLEATSSPPSTDGTIPVIDLAAAPRGEVAARVKRAAETVGFFQVTSHGVHRELMAGVLAGVRRFNEQPAEVKRRFYTRDTARKVRFCSNYDLFQSKAANWRDTLFCELAPDPPRHVELPEAVRGVMLEYGDAATKLALWVLELLSESLGLAGDHLREMGCARSLNVASHYYPPCPGRTSRSAPAGTPTPPSSPSSCRTPWAACRCSSTAWAGWTSLPCPALSSSTSATFFRHPHRLDLHYFPRNCYMLVSNGRLRSVEHRVLANKSRDTPRVSVACFFNADTKRSMRLYGPITDGSSAPLYKSVTAREFVAYSYSKGLDGRPHEHFRLGAEEHASPSPAA